MDRKKKVLIVDDEHEIALICKLIFERRGYEVVTLLGCEEMEELLNAVKGFQPDIIFMDHNMPGICGFDAIKALKADPACSQIHIIYFSVRDDIEKLAKESGADSYLQKPFEISSLVSITRKFT